MKRIALLLALAASMCITATVLARKSPIRHHVKGHFREGKWVRPHMRGSGSKSTRRSTSGGSAAPDWRSYGDSGFDVPDLPPKYDNTDDWAEILRQAKEENDAEDARKKSDAAERAALKAKISKPRQVPYVTRAEHLYNARWNDWLDAMLPYGGTLNSDRLSDLFSTVEEIAAERKAVAVPPSFAATDKVLNEALVLMLRARSQIDAGDEKKCQESLAAGSAKWSENVRMHLETVKSIRADSARLRTVPAGHVPDFLIVK